MNIFKLHVLCHAQGPVLNFWAGVRKGQEKQGAVMVYQILIQDTHGVAHIKSLVHVHLEHVEDAHQHVHRDKVPQLVVHCVRQVPIVVVPAPMDAPHVH